MVNLLAVDFDEAVRCDKEGGKERVAELDYQKIERRYLDVGVEGLIGELLLGEGEMCFSHRS